MLLKLLDYGEAKPFGEIIGRPRRLAWAVHAYRVTLPIMSSSGDGLNAFERVILKLLTVGGVMNAQVLSDETCIPLDLVNMILLRLRDKTLIDEYNVVIEQKNSKDGSEKESELEFVTALLFRELATGKFFPFLGQQELRTKEKNPDYKIYGDRKNKSPVSRDVIIALRGAKKRSAIFNRYDNRMPTVQQITIVPQPELYYLDCPIAIQKSDGEYRIADPFGMGYSLILEKAFEQLLEQDDKLNQWLSEWKQSLSNNARPQKWGRQQKESFGNDTNRQRYPKLIEWLNPRKGAKRSILEIYASIEWAFFYSCCIRPFEDAIQKLKFHGESEQSVLLGDAAKDIGLSQLQSGFKSIRYGKILDFQNEKAELGTVLAIAILQAESDESHPLRRIAFKYPDFVACLFAIKKKRDEKAHGKGRADAAKEELDEDSFMREVVHTLLSDIVFADTLVTDTDSDEDAHADAVLEARNSIRSEFGRVYNHLGDSQSYLIAAEQFWHSWKDEDDIPIPAITFACDLYSALQATFSYVLAGKLPPDIVDSELISAAQKKARVNGFGDLLLHAVKPLAIRQTLQGSAQTLGACVIAFLLISDDDALSLIANAYPSFLLDIANITEKRGHGNESLSLRKDEIVKLRKSAYSIIKTLKES